MARFRTEGLDDLIEDMADMGLTTGELADEMLMAGAEEVKRSWEESIRHHELIDTGDMVKSIRFSREVKQISDIKSVDIYPQGKDRKGIRNAEKAFINHYGTSEKEGTHFVDYADDIAGPRVEKRFTEIYDEWLRKHGMRD